MVDFDHNDKRSSVSCRNGVHSHKTALVPWASLLMQELQDIIVKYQLRQTARHDLTLVKLSVFNQEKTKLKAD